MVKTTDLTAILPDGQMFDFWEVPQEYDRELTVFYNPMMPPVAGKRTPLGNWGSGSSMC